MKNPYGKVRTRFGREVRFKVQPVPFRAVETTQLENLKERLLHDLLQQADGLTVNAAFRRAATDAAALAWATPYPLLVFPILFEEKAQVARFQAERQAQVFEQTQDLLLKAA